MFKHVLTLTAAAGKNISDIVDIAGKIPPHLRPLMNSIKNESKWKGTLVELKNRIRKLVINNKKFVKRDVRKLKKLLKEKKGKIDENLLAQFPGKTLEDLEEFKRSLKKY